MSIDLKSPHKARLEFNVGVVGHRPNRLTQADEPALRLILGTIMATIKESVLRFQDANAKLIKPDAIQMRVISPLAEGSDRLVAEEAMQLGYRLLCPMPFPQAEYEKDFIPPKAFELESLNKFRQLLGRAKSLGGFVCLEGDGSRADEGRAYGAAGRVVLNHADILIAIWDGKPTDGEGGTVEKIQEAVVLGLPVIWIDAVAPHNGGIILEKKELPAPSVMMRATPWTGRNTLKDLDKLVQKIMALPPRSCQIGSLLN